MQKATRIILVAVMSLCGGVARAQEDAARAQVQAATANAMAALRAEVLASRITPGLTVAQFLEQTDAFDTLDQTIQRAQQIGGPRWIDDQTCQVKLEITGARIAYTLVSIAATHRNSPMPAEALERRLSAFKARSFAATGTSISAERLASVPPPTLTAAWQSLGEEARQQTVDAARRDAVQRVLDSIRPIELAPRQTVDSALSREPVARAMNDWLMSRPATGVRFGDDMSVEVTLAADPDEVFGALIASARDVPDIRIPGDEQATARLRAAFVRRMARPTGRAVVVQRPQAATHATIELPGDAPSWISAPIDAEAVAASVGSKLRTARAAEANALAALRARVLTLPLAADQTIGEAVESVPGLGDALNRAMLRARVHKVDYRPDGSVQVKVSLDPRDLWEELWRSVQP